MFLSYYDLQMHCFLLYITPYLIKRKNWPLYVILKNFQEHFVPAENKRKMHVQLI